MRERGSPRYSEALIAVVVMGAVLVREERWRTPLLHLVGCTATARLEPELPICLA